MRIAILGATSQIAKDLVFSYARLSGEDDMVLFARRPEVVAQWMASAGLGDRYMVADFSAFHDSAHFDAILNFVGVGNPAQAAAMGASIFDVTLQYDGLALNYVRSHPQCRYAFLSSGAAYGASFDKPVDRNSRAVININGLQPQDWYAAAKIHAECRHRSLCELPIIDIRVFNYFSRTQDMAARFLITDMVRSIRENTVLKTSSDYIVRDFLHPSDFYGLIRALLSAPERNVAVDCYSLAPIDKPSLLVAMQNAFGLQYEVSEATAGVNATGRKPHYYSRNTLASEFGYQPAFTSLDGILKETRAFLHLASETNVPT